MTEQILTVTLATIPDRVDRNNRVYSKAVVEKMVARLNETPIAVTWGFPGRDRTYLRDSVAFTTPGTAKLENGRVSVQIRFHDRAPVTEEHQEFTEGMMRAKLASGEWVLGSQVIASIDTKPGINHSFVSEDAELQCFAPIRAADGKTVDPNDTQQRLGVSSRGLPPDCGKVVHPLDGLPVVAEDRVASFLTALATQSRPVHIPKLGEHKQEGEHIFVFTVDGWKIFSSGNKPADAEREYDKGLREVHAQARRSGGLDNPIPPPPRDPSDNGIFHYPATEEERILLADPEGVNDARTALFAVQRQHVYQKMITWARDQGAKSGDFVDVVDLTHADGYLCALRVTIAPQTVIRP